MLKLTYNEGHKVKSQGQICKFEKNTLILNSGARKRCIISHILFSLYVNDIQINGGILSLIKYADDLT